VCPVAAALKGKPVVHVLLLAGCAAVIYVACEWFVNAVEWLGVRLQVGPVAVGTILAAAGTALPESVVTLVAVLFGSKEHGADVAVGAALGGPLVVGTISYGVAGWMLLARRRRGGAAIAADTPAAGVPDLHLPRHPSESDAPAPAPDADELDGTDTRRLARDQVWFLVIFAGKVALGLVAFAFKPWLGVLFLLAYAAYFRREVSGGGEHATDDDLEPLRFQRSRAVPSTAAVLAQTLATLVVVFLASQLFVQQLEWAGPALGLSPVVVALLLSPIATELPETMNAIIWVRQGKAELALANISGSMMIQATVPTAIGLFFTPWLFGTPLVLAGVTTLAAVGYLLAVLRSGRLTPGRLAAASLFYVAFAVALVVHLA
jgi:cation:H+ antiporter